METKSTQRDLLQSQTQSEETNTNKEQSGKLMERIQVPGELFMIIGSEDSGYMVTFGKYQITKRYKSIQECKDKIEDKDYELLFALMGVAIAEHKTQDGYKDWAETSNGDIRKNETINDKFKKTQQ